MMPLDGVRIVAIEQYGAGPFGTTYLADLGADVIKIENPEENGELGRRVGPFFVADNDSHFYQCFNRNKRSVVLNLKMPEGQAVLHDLVKKADACLNNLRGDQPEKLGLTYPRLAPHNPKLVCVHLSAYGRSGSRTHWPGFDYLMQAEAGHLSLTGDPAGSPEKYGLSVVDYMSGLTASFALVSGVLEARSRGIGRDLDVSLFDVALYNLGYQAAWYLNEDFVQGRLPRSAHPSIVPCQLYRTADGWIFIMCNKEKFWVTLAEQLGHAEWLTDPRYDTAAHRQEHREELTQLLDEVLQVKSTATWLAEFAGAIPAAPVNDVAQALDSDFVSERQGVLEVTHQSGRAFRQLRNPVRFGDPEAPVEGRAAPALGADTDAVLSELGYDASRIATLRTAGAVG